MGNYVNTDNTLFQESLNSKIYVDKTGLIEYYNIPLKNSDKIPIIIELKWNKNAETAINQIKEKNYIKILESYDKALLVGINYDKKKKNIAA